MRTCNAKAQNDGVGLRTCNAKAQNDGVGLRTHDGAEAGGTARTRERLGVGGDRGLNHQAGHVGSKTPFGFALGLCQGALGLAL